MLHSLETRFTQIQLAYCQLIRQSVKPTDMYIHGDGNGLSVRAHNNEEVHGSLYIQLCREDVEMFATRYVLAHESVDEVDIYNTEYVLKDYIKDYA